VDSPLTITGMAAICGALLYLLAFSVMAMTAATRLFKRSR